jgi:dolichyl-phosphate beta-glucosyltransferase
MPWLFLCLLFPVVLIGISVFVFLYFMPSRGPLWEKQENVYLDPWTGEKKSFPSLGKAEVYLSVVIPAYNEEKRLPKMLDETLAYLQQRHKLNSQFTYEIIVVNDGSRDATTTVALQYAKQLPPDSIRVLTLTKNRGKGGAVRRGMLCSRGRYVLMVDADGATKFADFAQLEKRLQANERDGLGVAIGSRAKQHEEEVIAERNLFRVVLAKAFRLLVMFCVRELQDTQCGFKLFTRKAAQLLASNLHIERWAFDVELLFLAQQMGIPIEEVPVNWTEIAGSTLNPLTASLQMAKDILYIRTLYLLGIWSVPC